MTTGTRALGILAAHGQWRIEPGLTAAELDSLESRFELRLNDDHREFLSAGLPVGSGWPDWRNADEVTLRMHIGRPVRELLQAVREGQLWLENWGRRPHSDREAVTRASRALAEQPRVVPVYGVAFLRQGPRPDPTVWAVQDHTVTAVGADLVDLARMLTGQSVDAPAGTADVPFVPSPAELDVVALAIPPFSPDPDSAAPVAVRPPTDPASAFAAFGVELSTLTRHDDVLAPHAPMWTLSVDPSGPGVSLWESVRARFSDTGLWPVLLTDRTWHRIGLDGIADDTPVLTAALDGARWLENEFRDRTADCDIARAEISFRPRTGGDWKQSFVDFDHRREYTTLALVPTPADWYVPGLLQWSGAVNSDVLGIGHAAVLRRWAHRYRTEVIALGDEFLTLRASAPPADEAAGLAAALEAWMYCDDAVNTQAGSLDALASMLTDQLWTFWWD
ncbi:DUF4253 domain-containing protein [Mycolicibacterium sp. HK-90]|uniref:DUF4253 domain-containing protein n=1 Tax=Mycolicibacterium sp. HK-90 TaxID=3056937 RepID=UPI00265920B0|nr:DUF4253 domain-containing protein [Mycolicibacterium sp. HK-90]WKG06115.1 DUF4253 domain-containing protein [Mycolicibacterium sp. HK-90]